MPCNRESIQPAGCSFPTCNLYRLFLLAGGIASNSVTDAVSIALCWYVPGSFPQLLDPKIRRHQRCTGDDKVSQSRSHVYRSCIMTQRH